MTARERMEIERSGILTDGDLFWGDALAQTYGRPNVGWVTRNRGLTQYMSENDVRQILGWCTELLSFSPSYWRFERRFLLILDVDSNDLPYLFEETP